MEFVFFIQTLSSGVKLTINNLKVTAKNNSKNTIIFDFTKVKAHECKYLASNRKNFLLN